MALRIGHLALAGLISLTGCAMCDNPFDCYYAAYGSRLPRADMVHGRVGSILDPPGGGVLTTQEMATGEYYGDGDFAGDYEEGIVGEGAIYPEGTGVEFEAAPLSADELMIGPPAAVNLDPVPAPGTEELDQAFEAINDELSTEPEK